MTVEHSKKVIHDLAQIIDDSAHKNIFHLLADLKALSEDVHGVLPELQHLNKQDAKDLAESSYEVLKAILGALAGA